MRDVTGTHISYLFICPTKLWYFSHQINMEQNSDIVRQGKFIHENTYKRDKKEIKIDGIAIDFIRKGETIELHEVKKSKKLEQAHLMQTAYYLKVLKEKGIKATAIIDYPLQRERKEAELTEELETKLEEAKIEILRIISLPSPPTPKRLPYCKKCSYYELCWTE